MKKDEQIPSNNLRSLLQRLSDGLDLRLQAYRKGTRYEKIRPSDVRIFVLAIHEKRTMADLARVMQVSRQAIHSSVRRLASLGMVELKPVPGNQRDKFVAITEQGQAANALGAAQVRQFEAECASVIGHDGLEKLREMLMTLNVALGRDAPIHQSQLKERKAVRNGADALK